MVFYRFFLRCIKATSKLYTSLGNTAIGMKLISVKMPEALIDGMDELIKKGVYPSRSALMRTAVRDLLRKELWRT